jgi:hypothetical protein
MKIVQVFNGDDRLLTEALDTPVDEDGMSGTILVRVTCGIPSMVWSLDIEIGEWNGIPRIISVKTEDNMPVVSGTAKVA